MRQANFGDTVLYDPEELAEVELECQAYVFLRERDVHAISEPAEQPRSGMYL
ncbi:hypothetical protein [Brevibacterium picturae]|uniref:Uncharacterized protein n=1 Tax=Brevibacterium picturae TaxID=260553 RepID=A0ABN2B3Y3_9MICO